MKFGTRGKTKLRSLLTEESTKHLSPTSSDYSKVGDVYGVLLNTPIPIIKIGMSYGGEGRIANWVKEYPEVWKQDSKQVFVIKRTNRKQTERSIHELVGPPVNISRIIQADPRVHNFNKSNPSGYTEWFAVTEDLNEVLKDMFGVDVLKWFPDLQNKKQETPQAQKREPLAAQSKRETTPNFQAAITRYNNRPFNQRVLYKKVPNTRGRLFEFILEVLYDPTTHCQTIMPAVAFNCKGLRYIRTIEDEVYGVELNEELNSVVLYHLDQYIDPTTNSIHIDEEMRRCISEDLQPQRSLTYVSAVYELGYKFKGKLNVHDNSKTFDNHYRNSLRESLIPIVGTDFKWTNDPSTWVSTIRTVLRDTPLVCEDDFKPAVESPKKEPENTHKQSAKPAVGAPKREPVIYPGNILGFSIGLFFVITFAGVIAENMRPAPSSSVSPKSSTPQGLTVGEKCLERSKEIYNDEISEFEAIGRELDYFRLHDDGYGKGFNTIMKENLSREAKC